MAVVIDLPPPAAGPGEGVAAAGRAILASVRAWDSDQIGDLTDAECLDLVHAMEAIKAAAAAVQARATASFVASRDARVDDQRSAGEIDGREASQARAGTRAEVALARRCSPSQADRHVGLARALTREMPETMRALSDGEISEWRATILVRETATVSADHRGEIDRRLAPDLRRLGDRALGQAARRAAIELDQEAIVERHRRAAASRRVSVRPAPDGMAYLTILGPMIEIVGAQVALTLAEKQRWVATGDPEIDAVRAADERGSGAWMADRALELLSGRSEGQPQPVEVGLVMTPGDLLGRADGRGAGVAEIPGHGAIPGSMARDHVLRLLALAERSGADDADSESAARAGVWLRRLFTSPDGRDLVAMDSRRRLFAGQLRHLIRLRDQTCRIPFCDAPIRHIDHVERHADGGATSAINSDGLCERHNHVKDLPGWRVDVIASGLDPGGGPHTIEITTPTGARHLGTAPPVRGHGTSPPATSPAPSAWEHRLGRLLAEAS